MSDAGTVAPGATESGSLGRVMVTGSSSGLGQALHRTLAAERLSRSTLDQDLERFARSDLDVIVHCAADARSSVPAGDLPAYLQSNLTLTERVLEVPHRLFVYISSQAVYPNDGRAWREDDALNVDAGISVYGIFKLLAEDAVRRRARQALILRCASLVGPEGRSNNIMRVLRRQPGPLFLSSASHYNLIAYSQLEAFIREAVARELGGTFNIGSTDWVTLAEIARHLNVDVEFGEHLYEPARADLGKIQRTTGIFSLTALAVADAVARELGPTR